MREKLTPTQGRILRAMRDDPLGFAGFYSAGSRKLGFIASPAMSGGIVIRCYGDPAYFMVARGLIELVKREGIGGYWYRLTEAGRAAVGKQSGGGHGPATFTVTQPASPSD